MHHIHLNFKTIVGFETLHIVVEKIATSTAKIGDFKRVCCRPSRGRRGPFVLCVDLLTYVSILYYVYPVPTKLKIRKKTKHLYACMETKYSSANVKLYGIFLDTAQHEDRAN